MATSTTYSDEARGREDHARNAAPITFAASSSPVLSGVASSGSSVRACFSPITLWAATDIPPVTVVRPTSSASACWKMNA